MKTNFHLLLILVVFSSCTPIRKLKFIQDDRNTAKNEYFNDRSEKLIQPYDYLYIKIYSLDEKTHQIFNPPSYNNGQQTELQSYAVDDEGNINFPFIGTVNVKDLTINQAKEKIESSLKNYLKSISVIVRFVGNNITVLGEVNRPGVYSFYDEKITIFQALGYAQGVNTYGNLTDVTLVRENNNTIKYHALDLTNKTIVASDYYYLNPNDVIIINPINAKYRGIRDYSLTIISYILSTTTTILTIYFATKK